MGTCVRCTSHFYAPHFGEKFSQAAKLERCRLFSLMSVLHWVNISSFLVGLKVETFTHVFTAVRKICQGFQKSDKRMSLECFWECWLLFVIEFSLVSRNRKSTNKEENPGGNKIKWFESTIICFLFEFFLISWAYKLVFILNYSDNVCVPT